MLLVNAIVIERHVIFYCQFHIGSEHAVSLNDMVRMSADERMTSSDAAAALGLEGASRLKQKVNAAAAQLVIGNLLQLWMHVAISKWH